jgi:hypothetical protein
MSPAAFVFRGSVVREHELSDWVNFEAIKLLTHHTSAIIVAVVLFWFVGFVVQRLLPAGLIRHCVLLVDEFMLLCLFVYFAYELLMYL